jgi:hypothetical protein
VSTNRCMPSGQSTTEQTEAPGEDLEFEDFLKPEPSAPEPVGLDEVGRMASVLGFGVAVWAAIMWLEGVLLPSSVVQGRSCGAAQVCGPRRFPAV